MRNYRYRVVDVFTTRQFEGNPLAVFPDAHGLDDLTMQRIARELNLSETVFVFASRDDKSAARLRIFTPGREVPFAGHPTIGTGFVLLDEGGIASRDGVLVLEENIGPIAVRVDHADPPMLWLTTPPIRECELFDRSSCANVLGLSLEDTLDLRPQILDAGNPTLIVALRDEAAVDRAALDPRAIRALRGSDSKACCVFVFAPTAAGAYSRMFAPDYGVHEDPATGSSTGPLALYMMRSSLISSECGTRFISEQGTKMGRRSILHVNIKGRQGCDAIEVGGCVTSVSEAWMALDS